MYLIAKLTARVTSSTEDYGSLALCPELMKYLGVKEYQQCVVNGKESRNDITYIIEGNPGEVGIRGNLSTKHKIGDKIHILFFGEYKEYPNILEI